MKGDLLLDLGVLGVSPFFFLSYSSIAFVALVGFESEGFEHFVCSCHLHLVHRFEFSPRIRGGGK